MVVSNFSDFNLNRHRVSFSSKSSVKIKCLGKSYLVPKAVADVRFSVKRFLGITRHHGNIGNVVLIDNNLYLGCQHYIKHYKYKGIGKYCEISKKYFDRVAAIIKDSGLDLAIFKTSKNVTEQIPVKIAKTSPEIKGEAVYIIGANTSFKSGLQIIPAVFLRKKEKLPPDLDLSVGNDASFYEIFSKPLAENKIHGSGLSGSPVFNKNGELIGLLSRIPSGTESTSGKCYITDVETIWKFFDQKKKEIESLINIGGNKHAAHFLSWLKQVLLFCKYPS